MDGTVTRATGGYLRWLCFAAAIIEGFDIQSAGVAAPKLAPALALTPGQMGWFFSAATLGLMIGALIGGHLADNLGRRAGLIGSLVVFGAFSIATAYIETFTGLFAMRFLTGVGLGGALPNLVAITVEASSPDQRSSAVGMMYAGIPLGGAVASTVSVLGLHDDWRMIFLIGGILPLALVPLLAFLMPPLRVAPKSRDLAGKPAFGLRRMAGGDRLFMTLYLWVRFFFSLLVLYLLLNWLPALLVSRGFSKADAGTVQIAFNLSGALGCIVAGTALDRAGRRRIVIVCYGALVASLAFLAVLPTNIVLACIGGAFVGFTILAVQSILYGIAPQCYPTEIRGTGVGLAVAAGRLGSIAGPMFAGGLVAAGRSPGEVLVGIVPFAILGGLATFLLVRRSSLMADTAVAETK